MNGTLVKTDKHLFAVYQTIYSNADTDMYFDWEKRLNETKWTDECYWVMLNDKAIGGILVLDDCTRYPFLIEPFCDRRVFWRIVIDFLKENRPEIHKLYGALDADVPILLSLGYKIEQTRRIMCRPTEKFPLRLNKKFSSYIPDIEHDLIEMTDVVVNGYKNSIDYLLDPADEESNRKEAGDDLVYYLKGYAESDTLCHSTVIRENETNKIVGLCIAGRRGKEYHPSFSFISDITVLPEYRGLGLAKYMIQHSLTNASAACDAMLLCVTVGNNAEALYRDMGFFGGPCFTNMSKLC